MRRSSTYCAIPWWARAGSEMTNLANAPGKAPIPDDSVSVGNQCADFEDFDPVTVDGIRQVFLDCYRGFAGEYIDGWFHSAVERDTNTESVNTPDFHKVLFPVAHGTCRQFDLLFIEDGPADIR